MSVRKWIGVSLIVAAFCVLATADAAGQAPVLERVLESGELRVGVSGSQPPMNVKSRTGEIIGLEADLAQLFADAFGVQVRFVERPFADLLDALRGGEADIVMSSVAIIPQRSLETAFVGPYMISGRSLLTKSRVLAEARSTDSLNRPALRLAALARSTSALFITNNLPEATLVPVQEYDAAVQMILDDEIDGLVADMPICVLSVLRYPNRGLVTLEQPLDVEPIGIALSPEDARFKDLLQSYLAAFEGTGLMDQLRQKWLEDGSWIAALP